LRVYRHVWTEDKEGLEWYVKRGFGREEQVLAGHYLRLKSDSAFVLRRRIQPSNHSQTLSSQPTQTPVPATATSEDRISAITRRDKKPGNPTHARSFQDRGPEREWNDLPENVLGNRLLKPKIVI